MSPIRKVIGTITGLALIAFVIFIASFFADKAVLAEFMSDLTLNPLVTFVMLGFRTQVLIASCGDLGALSWSVGIVVQVFIVIITLELLLFAFTRIAGLIGGFKNKNKDGSL